MLVRIGALSSKMIDARFVNTVPSFKKDIGFTEKLTEPSPCGLATFGGKNPSNTGSSFVMVSIEVNCHSTMPEAVSNEPFILTLNG